jgi:hypothetical protein
MLAHPCVCTRMPQAVPIIIASLWARIKLV